MAAPEVSTPRFYWLAVAAFAIVAAIIFYARPPVLAQLRGLAFDAYQHASPAPAPADSPIRVVQIDEASLARYGQWPWPRTTMADLTQKLGEAGAAAIVFDILFAEPDRTSPEQVVAAAPPQRRAQLRRALSTLPSHDGVFADTLGRHPSVLATSLHQDATTTAFPMHAGWAAAGDEPGQFLPNYAGLATNLPALSDAASGTGFINWLPDGDQVMRRVPLLLRYNGEITPSLSLEALRVAVGASTYVVRASNANGTQAFGAHTGIDSIKVGPITIPTDEGGQVWVRFRPYNSDEAIPAWKILSGEIGAQELDGTIVLIGASAPGLMDLRATPLDASIPGVEVHRQLLEQIVAGNFLTRPDYASGIELLAAIAAILLLAYFGPRVRPTINAAIGAVLVVLPWGAGFLLFAKAGYLFDPIYPTLAALVFSAAATTYFFQRTEHQRAGIRRAFSQYVAPDVVRQLTAHPERLKLGGEVRELTILVCDIRNFSSIAERMNAEELTSFINSFLTPLSDIIIETGGTIDKYMGDAILAFWNAPLDQTDHAKRALEAARSIVVRMDELNLAWKAEADAVGRSFEEVRIGIGLNTGSCCVGNLGSERRFDYSAIGDAVNIASRLESLSKIWSLSLLISEDTKSHASDAQLIEVALVRLKGRSGATRIFTALPGDAGQNETHAAFLGAFNSGRLSEASNLLAALEAAPLPGLSRLYHHYRERLEAAAAASSGEWDGVYDPDRK
ncbi:MAG: adenylate/guanylate cyclase domain-containing protein [Alphaproteobacteria bacterium]|nr:adenylate/guanylate cyclase domain-containing protein [Alphaproteobacteria bacterium]